MLVRPLSGPVLNLLKAPPKFPAFQLLLVLAPLFLLVKGLLALLLFACLMGGLYAGLGVKLVSVLDLLGGKTLLSTVSMPSLTFIL